MKDSYLERALDIQIARAGLPKPVKEYEFARCWGKKWRADRTWLDDRLMVEIQGGVELDSGGGHRSKAGYQKDCKRLAAATLLGYRVLYVTKRTISSGEAVRWIERALDRRYEGLDRQNGGPAVG